MRSFGACLFFVSTLSIAADITPLVDGDRLTGIGVYVGGAPDGGLTYTRIGEVTYKLAIDAEGRRNYVHGSAFWIFDHRFTRLLFRGVELSPGQRFELLPPSGKVEPGMRWDVPVHLASTLCGPAEARFKASAEKGPDVPLVIDGSEVRVPTVRVVYETPLTCGGRGPWLRTEEMLFSPDLYEIVHTTTVNYDGPVRGALQLGDPGRGWRLQSITTARSAGK